DLQKIGSEALYLMKNMFAMKQLFLLLIFLLTFLGMKAQPPSGDALPGDTYGDTSGMETTSFLENLSSIDAGEVLTGYFTGTVAEVCPKKGCWIQLKLEDGKSATVKMKDYGFFVPLSLTGKDIIIHGEAELKITSVGELKHLAEDAEKSQEEIDAITEPKETITILATGIKVAG